ncbi:PIN-like domain-containing protein [Elizabethkingia meningoseptica]|uniref:PIN-like domain-containing protein n=1 Tax=Elizabethkingia meningoseptica TaxID=238 RepID=UPI00093632A0|nr:PIN-like domain-containing protein [Elizabethkingia meningoseptica]MDE5487297.1 hypothetical protein [Elizabethkingia meningoseptica]MVW93705.1 hypothetical protein [Elizabethkingia meningoseptica]
MDRKAYNIYELSKEREQKLWEDCIFIFDSSALLDLYYYPEETRDEIYSDVFKKIKDRIWLANHIQYEFLKNRKNVILKPITENYTPLIDKILKPISDKIKETETLLDNLKKWTKNKDKHPYIEHSEIIKFEGFLKEYSEKYTEFSTEFTSQMEEKKEEISKLKDNDTVLSTIESYFPVGREYSFQEILKIAEEGKIRYEFDIPPGYEDLKKEKKVGTQIFGDLIIWKQILEHAKEINKNVVFICNDLKDDWCELDKKATEKRIKTPRPELIKEFNDYTGKEFWMYNQAQFIYSSNELLKSSISVKQIEQISHFITEKNKRTQPNYLVYKCYNCDSTHSIDVNDLDLDYECIESDERKMGRENHYEALSAFECMSCDYDIIGTFSIWEYPVGAINYTDIELEGAYIMKKCDLYMDLHDEDPEPEDYGQYTE